MILLCASVTNRLSPQSAASAIIVPPGVDPMKLLAARIQHLVPANARKHVGDFITPRARQMLGKTPIWAADNDAFSGFDPDAYLRMLDKIAEGVSKGLATPPAFVTVPDVVCDHFATMRMWDKWSHEVRKRGLSPAFVLQNGVDYQWNYWMAGHADFPWDDMDAFFIGGDTPFKYSEIVREIVECANYHGKWVHMGRVNSVQRMRYAISIGCDSCDGSAMARFSSTVLLPMVRALDIDAHNNQHNQQLALAV